MKKPKKTLKQTKQSKLMTKIPKKHKKFRGLYGHIMEVLGDVQQVDRGYSYGVKIIRYPLLPKKTKAKYTRLINKVNYGTERV